MMFGHGLFQTRASMAAQIKTQAVTIGELSELVAKQDGEIKAQRCHVRQVEGQRDLQSEVNRQLVKDNTTLREKLAPFIARNRDPVTKRFVSTTTAGETAPLHPMTPEIEARLA